MSAKKKILIVDDSSFLRNSLRKLLEEGGFEVVAMAENGLEGVARYKELKPDLVTLDIIMPQMGGLEALKAIRHLDPGARVVVVSSLSAKEPIQECGRAGAKGYILKPFDASKVLEVVKKALV